MKDIQPNNLLAESEQALACWQAFARGDEKALGLPFRLFYTQLYKYGCKICPNTIIPEDCIYVLHNFSAERKRISFGLLEIALISRNFKTSIYEHG